MVKEFDILGVFWGAFTRNNTDAFKENMNELFNWFKDGKINPQIEEKFKLQDASKALDKILNRGTKGKQFIRLLVPIRKCNPSFLYFMYEDKLLNFNRGYTYFLNTNKKHAIFSFSDDSTMLVMNIKCCQEAIDKIHELMLWR